MLLLSFIAAIKYQSGKKNPTLPAVLLNIRILKTALEPKKTNLIHFMHAIQTILIASDYAVEYYFNGLSATLKKAQSILVTFSRIDLPC